MEVVREDRLYAAYRLAAMTGMRRGEVLGLRWQDVDFDRGRVAVRQTLVSVDYKIRFSYAEDQAITAVYPPRRSDDFHAKGAQGAASSGEAQVRTRIPGEWPRVHT
jgi:integrase